MEAGAITKRRKDERETWMRVAFEEAKKKEEEPRWHNSIVEVGKLKSDVKKESGKATTEAEHLVRDIPVLSVSLYTSFQTQRADEQSGETAAHLAPEVTDAVACLQDGHLHVLCGFFGLGRLLLQWDREGNTTWDVTWSYMATHHATLLPGRVWKMNLGSL